MPARIPEKRTIETALLAISFGTLSKAANLYCCINPPIVPKRKVAVQNRKKLFCVIANAASSVENIAVIDEAIKAFFLPIFFISITAGMVAIASPRTISVTGSVARVGDGAISAPIIPPKRTTIVVAAIPITWLILRT